jgi:hypothetical protein
MAHPSTNTRKQHHNWLDKLVHDRRTDAAARVSILVAFIVSLGHPQEEGKKLAGQIAAGIGAGWSVVKAFDTYLGHHFKDD